MQISSFLFFNFFMSTYTPDLSTDDVQPMYGPCSALWRPWDWINYPPCTRKVYKNNNNNNNSNNSNCESASKTCSSSSSSTSIITNKKPNNPVPIFGQKTVQVNDSLKNAWDFQYKSSKSHNANTNSNADADSNNNTNNECDEDYNVIIAVATANTQPSYDETIWCSSLVYQTEAIACVACFVISKQHPQGVVKYFDPLVDGSFLALQTLLDNAGRIYCFDDQQIYGRLRANPTDITTLPQLNPVVRPMNHTMTQNPFKPLLTDAFQQAMSFNDKNDPLTPPSIADTESVTRPRIPLLPDNQWINQNGSKNDGDGNQSMFDNEKNEKEKDKTENDEEVAAYESVPRWKGICHHYSQLKQEIINDTSATESEKLDKLNELTDRFPEKILIDKTNPPYFSDYQMTFWKLKTFSLIKDLEINDCTFYDLIQWNRQQQWWSNPQNGSESSETHFARNNFSGLKELKDLKDLQDLQDLEKQKEKQKQKEKHILGSLQYTDLFVNQKHSELKSQLEWEVRCLTDVLTAIHAKKESIIVHSRKFTKKINRYESKWESLTVSYLTPSMAAIRRSRLTNGPM
jgi:hypothetical protein